MPDENALTKSKIPHMKDPDKIACIVALREELDDYERLLEFIKLGLSNEAARDLREKAKVIEAVKSLLQSKKHIEKSQTAAQSTVRRNNVAGTSQSNYKL